MKAHHRLCVGLCVTAASIASRSCHAGTVKKVLRSGLATSEIPQDLPQVQRRVESHLAKKLAGTLSDDQLAFVAASAGEDPATLARYAQGQAVADATGLCDEPGRSRMPAGQSDFGKIARLHLATGPRRCCSRSTSLSGSASILTSLRWTRMCAR
jgi:hypothetical protein